MKCPFCGKQSDAQICPFCGMDKSLEERIRHTADGFYRKGYQALVSGDLSGAAGFLDQALFYDGKNTQLLNLRGLIYYHVGDIGEALSLWQRSLSIDDRAENRAHVYLNDLKKHESRLRSKQEAVRLYNEALEQVRSGSLDFAIARLRKATSLNRHHIKAHLLLALCHIEQKHYKQALNALDRVTHIDPLHPIAARYRRWITELAEQGQTDAEDEDVQDISEHSSVRRSLVEPDLTEIFGAGKNKKVSLRNWHATIGQIVLFILGALCMYAFIYTLKIPDELSKLRRSNAELKEAEEQQASSLERVQQELLKAQQYEYEAEQKNTENERKVKELEAQVAELSNMELEDALANAVLAHLDGRDSEMAMILADIDVNDLENASRDLYNVLLESMTSNVDGMYQSGRADYNEAKSTEDESQREYLLNSAYGALKIAMEFSEPMTSQQYWAAYCFADTCLMLGKYQEAVDASQSLLDTYIARDDFYDDAVALHAEALAALGG